MKKNEIHPELLNIDRMKSKPFTKKDFEGVSAFIKKNKEKNDFDDIECDVLQIENTPEMDSETSAFIKAYKEKMAAAEKKKAAKKQAKLIKCNMK
jgi:FMN-dependent NADH-azoreductase